MESGNPQTCQYRGVPSDRFLNPEPRKMIQDSIKYPCWYKKADGTHI